ncbi:MAG: hypothetical protein FJ225_00400 [Lentisphaerae bacterium]|nr:hypothetical protein [Lentisphaerota bacterium]
MISVFLKPETRNLKPVARLLVLAWLGLCLDVQAAASFRAHMIWVGEEPRMQVTIEPGAAATQTVWIAARPFNQRGESPDGFTGGFAVKLTGDGKPVTADFPVLNPGVPKDRLWTSLGQSGKEMIPIPGDYIRLSVRDDALGLAGEELVYPFRPGSPLQSCTVRLAGGFADRKALFTLHFGPHGRGVEQKAAIEYHLLDAEGNQLSSGDTEIVLSDTRPTDYEQEVTPKRDTTGPYTITFAVNNEALQISAASEARFPFATLLVPVSSMESDTLADWHIPGKPLSDGDSQKTPNILFSAHQPFVRPVFDSEVKRQGARSLRIDYSPGATAVIGSNVRLPGLPMAARIWVKGNNTRDRLVIEWRDPCNFSTASYQRWMNSMSVEICRLDFSDWKCFTVPVLGDGLLGRDNRSYLTGHSGIEVRHPIQAPIHCAALRVIPEPRGKDAPADAAPRSVWVDDILVETQAPRNERMTLELRGDTPERRLHADAKLLVAVGNGTPYEIRNGRIAVTFLDGDGETVKDAEMAEGIDAAMGEVAVKSLSLAALEARKPRGPVTAVVTVTGPVAGQRAQGRVVFSRPTGAGLVWDFERQERFNPMAPEWYYQSTYHKHSMAMGGGKTYVSLRDNNRSHVSSEANWMPAPGPLGAEPGAGGADGTARALPLTIATNIPVSVLLHPALPGIVESVEMQVFGEGVPVMLWAVFVDSKSAEFDMPFQQHAGRPVRVDWKGWKPCRFPAPPIPPAYGSSDAKINPFYAPQYPLNLALSAWTEDGGPAAIRVDQVKVSTHVPREQELVVELEYPDETMLHVPGQPLKLTLVNFALEPVPVDARYQVITPVGVVAQAGVARTTLAPGSRTGITLVENLREGFYHVRMDGLPGGRVFETDVQAPDRKRYFGEDVMARLADLRSLDGDLGLTERRINLDWDTAEPVPNLYHHNWFRRYARNASQEKTYDVVPIVGYCADWAGPEKQLAVADGTYVRDVGNYMQAPIRLADWNAFMRNVGREHAREFAKWVFWSNPDMPDPNPLYLPQDKYRSMFDVFCRWIRQYNADACIIAGGFTFDRVLGYLAGMPDPDTMPFDQFEVHVTPGSASSEEVQMEDFLEDLDARLKLTATGRKALIADLDWVTDKQFALLDQAAYHARAAILLHAAGALPHQFASVNKYGTQDGFGLLFHPLYGNSSIQRQRSFYVPKPAYFGLIETRKMLGDLEFLQRTGLADRDPQANRAYLFKQTDGNACAVVWRVRGARSYQLPAEWAAVKATDAFGVPVTLDKVLPVGAMPLFLRFVSVPADRVAHELRNLKPRDADKTYELVLDIVPSEAFARQAGEYKAVGGDAVERRPGRLVAGERVSDGFLKNVTEERFAFRLDAAGDVLLSRLWFLEASGDTNRAVEVVLNGVATQAWNLAAMVGLATSNTVFDKVYVPGPRRSALVLRGCQAGRNEVVLRHSAPTLSGGFRLTRIREGKVDLTAFGPLAGLDSGVPVQAFRNAAGGALTLGKQTYESGIGCMGYTALEYPLNGQFSRFDVTVGIDAAAKGRGSVGFRILVDGKETGKNCKSGPMTGMTLAKTLSVEGLEDAERLLLLVDDGGDGAENDLADWVDAVLTVKE